MHLLSLYGNPIHEAPVPQLLVLMLLPEAVGNSVVNDATEDRRFYVLHASALSDPPL